MTNRFVCLPVLSHSQHLVASEAILSLLRSPNQLSTIPILIQISFWINREQLLKGIEGVLLPFLIPSHSYHFVLPLPLVSLDSPILLTSMFGWSLAVFHMKSAITHANSSKGSVFQIDLSKLVIGQKSSSLAALPSSLLPSLLFPTLTFSFLWPSIIDWKNASIHLEERSTLPRRASSTPSNAPSFFGLNISLSANVI